LISKLKAPETLEYFYVENKIRMDIFDRKIIHDENGLPHADKSINEDFRLQNEESGINFSLIIFCFLIFFRH